MECDEESELFLDQWMEGIREKYLSTRYPLRGFFELTDRCNLNCVHCFINQPAGHKDFLNSELTTVQVFNILDSLAQAGCLFLVLTGGEVFLRKDFSDIYQHTLEVGILPSIFTNGTLITPESADLLQTYQPQVVDISLYGATRETFEAVTRTPGSYDRCMHTIEMLRSRNIRTALKTVVLATNRHELKEMQHMAEGLGVEFRYSLSIWPRLDGNLNPWDYSLSPEEAFAIELEDAGRMEEWRRQAERFNGVNPRDERVYGCGAGRHSFHIDARGNLSICTMARATQISLLENSFPDAWQELGSLRLIRRVKETPCQKCPASSVCVICPGMSQLVHGDNETPVESVCKSAKMRYDHLFSERMY